MKPPLMRACPLLITRFDPTESDAGRYGNLGFDMPLAVVR